MNATVAKPFGLSTLMNEQFQPAYERVLTALRAAGFEIIAEMNLPDFAAKKEEWHSQMNKVVVVCHPEILHRALIMSPEAGILMTCNVGVLQVLEMQVKVTISDTLTATCMSLEPHLLSIADELYSRLQRVIDALRK